MSNAYLGKLKHWDKKQQKIAEEKTGKVRFKYTSYVIQFQKYSIYR